MSSLVLVCFDWFIVKNQYMSGYQASLLDKVERLETINGPKIILVGNSNVAFGINSEKIEDAFGIPVVNLGLHGGLGNAFHENIAKLSISKGDIVIICHSDYSDDGKINDPVLAWTTIELHQELWKILDRRDYFDMIKAYPKYILRSGYFWLTGEGNKLPSEIYYSRNAFNIYGDVVVRPDINYEFSEEDAEEAERALEISDICVDRLNDLDKYCTQRGAVLIVAGYPIGDGEYTLPKEKYKEWEKELRERLNCEVISTFTDYFYPYSYFCNTSLHLTEEGAEVRTEQLIRDLDNWKNSYN